MNLLRIASVSILSTSLMGCDKEFGLLSSKSDVGFQLPTLFQQREVKGNFAGQQIVALGILRQFMKHDGFRHYAQERVRSETQEVVDHLLGKAKPSCLEESGDIPQDRIVLMNGAQGRLNFYNGRFNIKRKGTISRIPTCDIDGSLRQLDDKTIHHYLSIAKIAMSRCEDDSVILRPHLGLNGGAWQVTLFNGLMVFFQTGVRLAQGIVIREGIDSLAQMGQTGYNAVRTRAADAIRPHLSSTGQQIARTVIQAMESGSGPLVNYLSMAGQTPVEIGIGMAQNLAQTAGEQVINFSRGAATEILPSLTRDTVQGVMNNTPLPQQIIQHAGQAFTQFIGADGLYYYVPDMIHNTMPEVARDVATSYAASPGAWQWLANLMQFTMSFSF